MLKSELGAESKGKLPHLFIPSKGLIIPELLIWEKMFIYKNKEVAINFETPWFSDLYKLMDADGGRQKALVTGQSNSS